MTRGANGQYTDKSIYLNTNYIEVLRFTEF